MDCITSCRHTGYFIENAHFFTHVKKSPFEQEKVKPLD